MLLHFNILCTEEDAEEIVVEADGSEIKLLVSLIFTPLDVKSNEP
jgi:hypothetical protein